jgi:uncharacterized membrane protein YtjA (UPF0391 family)
MLGWIITFFILAVIAAFLGFGGMAATFAGVAKFLTALFLILFVISVVYSIVTGRRPSPPAL